ncbi:MAG: HAMP domain-containing histidine kinase [Deltaproteobacteria bacterium]|nr:HAMP domain-containing histidine kinase [Deltaproteobacteria bacterium]
MKGIMFPVAVDSEGGLMARRLLPAAVLVPILLGAIRWLLVSSGRSGTVGEVALFVTLNMAVLVTMVWIGAGILHRIDMGRKGAERERDESVSLVSHELRTPLSAMKGTLDYLQLSIRGSLTDKQLKWVEILARNTDRLIRILNNLLSLSRMESGKVRIKLQEVDLNPVLSDVTGAFLPDLNKRGIRLKKEVVSSPRLMADQDLLSEVLNNLVSNAIRYARGEVIIRVGSDEKNGHDPSPAKSPVKITVIDDGPGIASQDLPVLFQKFAQIDRSDRKEAYKGTGLGLAISKSIVEQMGGKIWAESQPGHGSQFHFILPQA